MKKIITLILLLLFLTSCGAEDVISNNDKKDFFVEIKSFSGFTNKTSLKKTGKLSSGQDIKLNSNASARVTDIYVKEGDNVYRGQKLAKLEDNIGSYELNLEKSKNALDRSYISYDSNKITLDKQVFDAESNLKTLKQNLLALEKNTQEDIKKAKLDLNNSNISVGDSKSSLELQKLDNSILKAELDYDNKLISDKETIEGFSESIKKEHNSLLLLLDDIIEFGDSLLGVTDLNKEEDSVTNIENFLGAKDSAQKRETEKLLLKIISYRKNDFKNINIDNLSKEDILSIIDILSKGYSDTISFLNSFEATINNSISSVGSLGDAEIVSHIGKINAYQSSLQINYTSFLGFQTNVKSFLRTYLKTQESILKQINLLKEDRKILEKTFNIGYETSETLYNKTIINKDDSISTLKLKINSAENTFENAKKTRDVSLRSLQNGINEANLGYKQALKEYDKLWIKSPISGTIGTVDIVLGEELNIGTPAFGIFSTGSNEVVISFNKQELSFVQEGSKAFMDFDGKTYTGSIFSISKVADQNLKYSSRISFDNSIDLIGNIVSIDVPIIVKNKLLPMSILKINNSGYATISILDNFKIKQLQIKLGNIYGKYIEVIDKLDPTLQIITNYIDNFDEEKFKLKIK